MKNNKNPDDYSDVLDSLYIEDKSVLTRKTPVKLMLQIMNGHIDRFKAWQALRLVHSGEEKCYFPQYGILTVFSLAKDMDEFKRLYDQGVQMLLDEGVVSDDEYEQDLEQQKIMFKKDLKSQKKKAKSKKFNPNNRLN
jgi:hypothetical protein